MTASRDLMQPTASGDLHTRLHRALVSRGFYPLALATGMIEVSYRLSHHLGFLRWDLALAWVPYVLSVALALLVGEHDAQLGGRLLRASPVFVAWLLFLPNAPYVVTDFVHFRPFASEPPWWLDMCFIAAVAWTGWFLGMMSLRSMHDLVHRSAGARAGWSFALGSLALSAFGIYLGRFLRWNSWDALVHPGALFTQLAAGASEPLAHGRAIAFTVLFAAFLMLTYVPLATPQLGATRRDDPPAAAQAATSRCAR